MNNKKNEKNKATKGKDITAEIAKKQGKKISNELPFSYKNGNGKKDKSGKIIPE